MNKKHYKLDLFLRRLIPLPYLFQALRSWVCDLQVGKQCFDLHGIKILLSLLFLAVSFSVTGQSNTVLWRIGKADNSSAEFSGYKAVNPESIVIPNDWNGRSDWSMVSKGLKRSSNPVMDISFKLKTLPANGVMLSFKLIDATKIAPEMAVFSNSILAGLIQLWGTAEVGVPEKWKKTYQLYIPKELLKLDDNVIRLEAARQDWSGATIDEHLWWEWDHVTLESLGAPAKEPIHGKLTHIGTTFTHGADNFTLNENTLKNASMALKWLGIAYSHNTIRANFWSDLSSSTQTHRLQYLELLKKYNMTVIADHISTGQSVLDADGTLSSSDETKLNNFFNTYGNLFQYYEIDNEPGLFNRSKAVNIEIGKYLNKIKPPHVKVTAPGWAYWPSKGNPDGWERDPEQRRQVEDLAQATNGHSYGQSFADAQGGSFAENLETYGGVIDGWPKEYVNTEMGTEDGHTDFGYASSTQPKAAIFDRIMRAHVAVVDRFLQHAFIFGSYSLFSSSNISDTTALTAHVTAAGQDTRLKTYRRLALAYATHGAPLPYLYLNRDAVEGKKVYFRGVSTAALAPLPGSGATANKILLNFVNFEGTQQVMKVRVTLPSCGPISGQRIGEGNTYAEAFSTVTLNASPYVDLEVTLGPRESVQYILDMPNATCTIQGGGQAPFGTSSDIPGIIEAENFDLGGEGVAYHDEDAGNTGGKHRPGEGVDIDATAAGNNFVSAVSGEWLEYTSNVKAGSYNLNLRVASEANAAVVVSLDGDVLDTLDIAATGGLQNWKTITSAEVVVEEGAAKAVRLTVIEGTLNLDNIEFSVQGVDNVPPTAVQNLRSTSKMRTSISLAWTSSEDNVGVTAYDVFVNGALIGTTQDTTFEATGLTAGIEYSFTIKAKDAVGNYSETAGPITLYTLDPGKPDFIITDIAWSPSNPVPGQKVSLRATIKNQGTEIFNGTKTVGASFKINGKVAAWSGRFSDSLNVGSEITLTADGGPEGGLWTVPSNGKFGIEVMVDDLGRIMETNEANNTLKDSISIASSSSSVTVTLTSPSHGTVFESGIEAGALSDTIQLAAAVQGTGVIKVEFLRDGEVIGTDETAPYGITLTNLQEGVHGFTARAIASGDSSESSASVLTINAPSPDFTVTDIKWTPENPEKGSPVTFTVVVKNIGKVASPESVILGGSFYVNGKQVNWFDTHTASVAPGQTLEMTANAGPSNVNYWVPTKIGVYTVEVHADDLNRIAERNENNNRLKKTFCVLDSLGNAWNGVKLTTPSNNTQLTVGSNILLTAELTSCGIPAKVAKVEFYQGEFKLGEATKAPYTFIRTINSSSTTNYQFIAKLIDVDGESAVSDTVNVTLINPCVNVAGAILREYWNGVGGANISDLTNNSNFPNKPSGSTKLTSFEFSGSGDNQGNRLSGILTPTVSGEYTFYTASDDRSELWLSTDENPNNKVKIAELTEGDGWAAWRQWNKYPKQKSAPIVLVAGKKYYIEALQKQAVGGYSLNVGWTTPGSTSIVVIPGSVLTVYVPRRVSLVNPTNNAVFPTDSLLLAANVSGCDAVSKVEFYAGNTKIGEDLSKPYQLPWKNIAVGEYKVLAKAIYESGEVLTSDTSKVNITGIVDLIVSDVTWTPSAPSTDDKVTFKATIKNQGTKPVDAVNVELLLNGSRFTVIQSADTLMPGETVTLTSQQWETNSVGSYELKVIADHDNRITESVETNNMLSRTVTVGKGLLRIPENPVGIVNGIDYNYYEGSWVELPDFDDRKPVKSGTVTGFSLTPKNRSQFFAFQFLGYLDIPANGQYTFYTTSDDGSKLYIGDKLVVDNDGIHLKRERSGTIALKAGRHAFRVTFFQMVGNSTLEVKYQGAGIPKQLIPNGQLYRLEKGVSVARAQSGEDVEEIGAEVVVAPNPVINQFSVHFYSSTAQKVRIRMMDLSSRVVMEREIEAVQGSNVADFSRDGLKSGMYMLQLQGDNVKEVKRVVLE